MILTDEYLDSRLMKAFTEARKGKTATVDEFKFEMNFAENLINLRESFKNRTYKPSRSTAFITHNPVDREIFAAPFRDRVVHHFICDYIVDWWERRLCHSSYSCRTGYGTDAGIRDLYAKMRKVSQNFHRETVVIKIDLSSYFCSIPRWKLYERVKWGLDRQFCGDGCSEKDEEIYKLLKYLSAEVIFDDPVEGAKIKGSPRDWDDYPKRKSLFYQKKGVGIVIGNLTSQVFSNIYLDQLDRFVTITLGIKNYGRYVDDAFFVIPEVEKEEFLREKLPKIFDFIAGMGLIVNKKKTFCQRIDHGIPFLGTVLYPYRVVPGKRVVRNFRSTIKEVVSGEKGLECLVSYLGRMQHFKSQRLIRKVFAEVGLDYDMSDETGPSSLYYTHPQMYNDQKVWG